MKPLTILQVNLKIMVSTRKSNRLTKNYLKDHGLDENANLYKPNFFEFFRYEDTIVKEDDPKFDKDKFEKLWKSKVAMITPNLLIF